MIPVRLIEALADEIRDATKDYKLRAEGQEDKKVTVYCQHIPDEDFLSDTYYPLVIVSVQEVTDDNEGMSIATVGLTIGVYGDDKEAWMDLLSIMERIRQRVCNEKIPFINPHLSSCLCNATLIVQNLEYVTIEMPLWMLSTAFL